MDMSRFMTNWIWTPDWTAQDKQEPRIVYFRKILTLDAAPKTLPIRITADSRYKLFVNGRFVQKGPQKALDLKEWYVDTAELAPYLREGENVVAVEVLRYPAYNGSTSHPNSNDSLLHTETPHLYVDGGALSGKTGWKCRVNREIRIVGENERPAPIHAQEDVTASGAFFGWKTGAFDDSDWQNAVPKLFFDMPMADAPGNLTPRTIPPMAYEDKRFEAVSAVREGGEIKEAWTALIGKDIPVTIPAHSTQVVELSAGAEECGYLLYAFAGGKGAKIATLCSECYAYPQPPKPTITGTMMPSHPKKGDRTDAENGQLFGHTSFYTAAGCGTADKPVEYEPYAFRTFRYIQLKIETADEPLTVLSFRYRATGYPLEEKTRFAVSDPSFAPIWDISLRTLRRCMHETYIDCPFYEQLQYAMDGRSEILYTYAVSADDRLARQAMDAFRRSQRPDGLVNADAPTVKSNVIPGFSIYYLLMVHDHMMWFGDKSLVKQHLPAIDQILAFFDRSLNELGLVGRVGGKTMRHKYWSFIDWSDKFEFGTPKSTDQGCGSITMESLLYLYGLQHAAELADFAGRPGLAEEYRERAEALKTSIRATCMGEYKGQKLLQDGPGVELYSVHSQVFAILTGVASPGEGKAMLQKTVGDAELAQSSVSFMFYLFRALEVCGWYEKTDELWNLWRQMVKNNMSTCVENDTDERSDCHAWASLLCYELPCVTLGVRPAAPGFAKVRIAPQMGALTKAEGDVITPKGFVHVEWKKTPEGGCDLHYTLPEGMKIK
ncbi:MAG: hypothetical protein IKT07_08780 [Oscillospiraceae bacterium]|nr:hypothetical protein [Oscillospiraceae bacterium]